MNEFKRWMSDCQGEWLKDEALKWHSPLYAQHMRQVGLTNTAQVEPSTWQFSVEKSRARILDPDFIYTPAASTDVQKTWRKFGWVPLSEQTK